MREVVVSEFVLAAVRRQTQEWPTFERVFQLADHVEVKGASLENGLLHIDLACELPEAKKPRHIPIGNGKAKVIDVKAA